MWRHRCIFVIVFFAQIVRTSSILDVVVPCHEKDVRTLEKVIVGIKKNIQGARRIIVVSAQRLSPNAEWFDESQFPFTKSAILNVIFNNDQDKIKTYTSVAGHRTGWIYQQLLKLYAPLIISGIADNVLVVDADTIFLQPVKCIDDQGYALYAVSDEYHKPYFEHAQRLLPVFKKVFPHYSGICHHMLLQRSCIEELFQMIYAQHNCEPWRALCQCIDHKELHGSCVSEYELYFNYVFGSGKKVKIRPLRWKNIYYQAHIEKCKNLGFDFVSWHNYTPEKSIL